jgi:hypothetical protein
MHSKTSRDHATYVEYGIKLLKTTALPLECQTKASDQVRDGNININFLNESKLIGSRKLN